MSGNEIMNCYWERQTEMYESMNDKDLKYTYRHWFADEGFDIEELDKVERDEMIWDLIEDEKRYKKDWEYAETNEEKEEIINELF